MPPHVLIVDDDIHARIILGTLVRRMGCEVIEASNANEALAILLDENAPFAIDLVITDVWMPGIDGLALLRTLREKLPSLPVAMVSARATLNSSLEAINNGAYAYLTKPFRAEEVQTVVERGLERGQEARARHELIAQFNQLAQLEGRFGDIQGQTAITENDMIGELISGLKHELGNIVSAIILNLEMLKRSPNIPAAMSENLNDLEASANDLARLLSRFKEYPQTPTLMQVIDLREVLSAALDVTRSRDIAARTAFDVQMTDQPLCVHASAPELSRTFVNLLDNAVEAARRQVVVRLRAQDGAALLTIEDDGPGFDASRLEHPFTPTATTKTREGFMRGIGLGLFIARVVIALHNAQITLQNREPGGARVIVRFPLLDEDCTD